MMISRRLLPLIAALAVGFLPALPAAAELAPHRAFYSLKLGAVRSGSSVVGVRGAMTINVERTCDGWIMGQRMSMVASDAKGGEIVQEIDFTGWESAGGETYRFASRSRGGAKSEDVKGQAWIGAQGGPGKAEYVLPKAMTLEIPPTTLFPFGHLSWLIGRAEAGARMAPRIVFDGVAEEGLQEVVIFIGPRIAPEEQENKIPGPLTERPGWNMRAAYYPVDSRAAEPVYEIEARQLDNGVATSLILDYQMFSVILDLERIEAVAPPVC